MKIIVVSHESLAECMVDCAQFFLGKMDNAISVGLSLGDNPDDFEEVLNNLIDGIDEQVLFICDIKSGTPFKTACKIAYGNANIRVLYGMNLAMVMECLSNCTEMNVNELVTHVIGIMPKSYGEFEL